MPPARSSATVDRSERNSLRVLDGEVRIKLNDEVETLRRCDAVWIPPATVRAVRYDTDEEAAFAMISVRVEDFRSESQPQAGFWRAEPPAHARS